MTGKQAASAAAFLISLILPVHSFDEDDARRRAQANALEARRASIAARQYIAGWWKRSDPETGLIPENLHDARVRIWTPRNSAADNWPYTVIAARFVNPSFFENEYSKTHALDQRLTYRVRRLPDDFDLRTREFLLGQPDMERITSSARRSMPKTA